MEITITLDYGPIDAEFVGAEREDLEKNLLNFAEFLGENEDVFDSIELSTKRVADKVEAEPVHNGGVSNEVNTSSEPSVNELPEDHPLTPIARRVNASVPKLEDLLYVSVQDEELPTLLVDDLDRLGDNKIERQRNTALLTLLLWEKCYGKEKMTTSDMKDIFSMVGISTNNTYKAWEKGYFKSGGHGGSAYVKLRGPGEREAFSLLRTLLNEDSE